MKPPVRPSKFGEPISARHRTIAAALVVMAGSLIPIVPVVSGVPWLPPFGLLLLLGWRLRSPDVLPVWAGAPLGLWDDLLSGQPLGCAMSLWTLAMVALDMIDHRLVWRAFWQDWLIAGGVVAVFLFAARLASTPIGAHVDGMIGIQVIVSAALYPLAATLCSRVDAWGMRPR